MIMMGGGDERGGGSLRTTEMTNQRKEGVGVGGFDEDDDDHDDDDGDDDDDHARCGQSFLLGRYCTHLHMVGRAEASYIRGNSIHHSFQRCGSDDITPVSRNPPPTQENRVI
jgi:hypothetical protein